MINIHDISIYLTAHIGRNTFYFFLSSFIYSCSNTGFLLTLCIILLQDLNVPTPIESFEDEDVHIIACGGYHSAAVTSTSSVHL